jgi:hypothetical protein
MTFGRIVLAGLVGGIVTFVWGALSHRALPLGEVGLQNMPAEEQLVPLLKQSITTRGLYAFPGMDRKDKSEAACNAWEEKLKAGPQGLLIYDPAGGEVMSLGQLGIEFVSNFLAAMLLAVVLSGLRAGKFAGALVGAGMGLFAWLSISISYWNWYRFPADFTTSEMIQQGVGGALTGLAIAWVLGRRHTFQIGGAAAMTNRNR